MLGWPACSGRLSGQSNRAGIIGQHILYEHDVFTCEQNLFDDSRFQSICRKPKAYTVATKKI